MPSQANWFLPLFSNIQHTPLKLPIDLKPLLKLWVQETIQSNLFHFSHYIDPRPGPEWPWIKFHPVQSVLYPVSSLNLFIAHWPVANKLKIRPIISGAPINDNWWFDGFMIILPYFRLSNWQDQAQLMQPCLIFFEGWNNYGLGIILPVLISLLRKR